MDRTKLAEIRKKSKDVCTYIAVYTQHMFWFVGSWFGWLVTLVEIVLALLCWRSFVITSLTLSNSFAPGATKCYGFMYLECNMCCECYESLRDTQKEA